MNEQVRNAIIRELEGSKDQPSDKPSNLFDSAYAEGWNAALSLAVRIISLVKEG